MPVFTLLAGAGFVTLALTVLIGFEEANTRLFVVSALLLAAAPTVVLGRLAADRGLTREQKRAWLRALFGRRALRAWSICLRRLGP